jgi:hypothetical protein
MVGWALFPDRRSMAPRFGNHDQCNQKKKKKKKKDEEE